MVSGLHHVSMRCEKKRLAEVIRFYQDVLGLPVARRWNGGVLFDTGAGLIEVFTEGAGDPFPGAVRHFALKTKSADACARRVEEAGYQVIVQPKDIVIPSDPPLKARVAFCKGPLNEEIEFFQQKR